MSCGWCYGSEARLACGKCKKRVFCSRACQVQDWKRGHKQWCGRSGEAGFEFEVREALGSKGLGVFALVDMKRGFKIMAERPVATRHGKEEKEEPAATRAAVDALLPVGGSREDKIALNGMSLDAEVHSTGTGLFVRMSRVNHDCVPNALHHYHAPSGVKLLVACRDISAGEEVTMSYLPTESQDALLGGSLTRAQFLALKWRFVCGCRACSDPKLNAKIEELRERDARILKLGQRGDFAQALRCGEAILRLYDDLQESHKLYAKTYYEMFQLAVARRKTLAKAKGYIKLAHDNYLHFLGDAVTDETLEMYALLVKSPAAHRAYLAAD
ncbi:hypothetical protein CTAYLR_000929 [Chrysophaeum taylorii]|uniref:Uncharacterized protein n=1 Tax=Chrysophaeum taylorii TaxID=2483200 RepID=A0AAD7XLH5_9STRA|nr:hypothetical protein CTAYLR_000929 [Chrysophaeum taylorii]